MCSLSGATEPYWPAPHVKPSICIPPLRFNRQPYLASASVLIHQPTAGASAFFFQSHRAMVWPGQSTTQSIDRLIVCSRTFLNLDIASTNKDDKAAAQRSDLRRRSGERVLEDRLYPILARGAWLAARD